MAWKNSTTSTAIGAAPRVHGHGLVEAEGLPHPREDLLVGLCDAVRELLRHRLITLLQAHLLERRVQRLPERTPLLLRPALVLRLDAGLHLLPDPGHREEPVGPHLWQEGDDLARVRRAGGGARVDDRDVVGAVALGDVGRRQPGDEARSGFEAQHLVIGALRAHERPVGDLDALGRTGGAGGVDQRGDVVASDLRRGGCCVEVRVRALQVGEGDRPLGGVSVDHDHLLERRQALAGLKHHREVGLLHDGDARARVVDEVRDLGCGIRLVDRERGRA